jgi:hypothetical protein
MKPTCELFNVVFMVQHRNKQKIKRGNINNSNGRMHFDDMWHVMFLENPFPDFG